MKLKEHHGIHVNHWIVACEKEIKGNVQFLHLHFTSLPFGNTCNQSRLINILHTSGNSC